MSLWTEPTMKSLYLVAAALTVLTAVAHSYLGERLILIPLSRREDLPTLRARGRLGMQTLRFVWHVMTVLAIGLAGLMFMLATPDAANAITTAEIISAMFAASGVLTVIIAWRHPAWVIFFAIAVLMWIG